MATLKEIIEYSKQNPDSEYAKQAFQRIQSGAWDSKAEEEGIDLSFAGRANYASSSQEQVEAQMEEEEGGFRSHLASLFGDVKDDFLDVGENIIDNFKGRTERIGGNIERRKSDGDMSAKDKAATALDFGGATLATLSDSVFQAIMFGAKTVTTEEQEQYIAGKIGDAAEAVAETEPVKKIVAGWNEFEANNPEAAANYRAAGDFASFLADAIGLKAGGAASKKVVTEAADVIQNTAKAGASATAKAADAVTDAAKVVRNSVEGKVTQATKGVMEKAGKNASESLKGSYDDLFKSTKSIKKQNEFIKSQGTDVGDILAERKIILDVEDGKVMAQEAVDTIDDEIATKMNVLDEALARYEKTVTVEDLKKAAHARISQNPELRAEVRVAEVRKKVDEIIDNYAAQEGKTAFRLADLQELKKGQWKSSKKFKMTDIGRSDANSELGETLKKVIEDNVPDVEVGRLNKEVGDLINSQRFLAKHIDGATVKGGRLGAYMARIIGTGIGTAGGGWFGGVAGLMVGDRIAKVLQNNAILNPIKRRILQMSDIKPNDDVLNAAKDFINKVDDGTVDMANPSDEVTEVIMKASLEADAPILPKDIHDQLRVQYLDDSGFIKLPTPAQGADDVKVPVPAGKVDDVAEEGAEAAANTQKKIEVKKPESGMQSADGKPLSSADFTNSIDITNVEKVIDNKLAQAPDAKRQLDQAADAVAAAAGNARVAKAPIKSRERAIEKVMKEELGNPEEIRDLARNTIMPMDEDSYQKVLDKMDARKDLVKRKDQHPEDYMGYEGIIYNIEMPGGLIAETQVVTPRMIYGKMPEADSRKILGDDLFEKIKAETGVEPELGHKLYEQYRSLSPMQQRGDAGQKITEQSIEYYNKLR